MINSENTGSSQKLITRRMFVLSSAKAVVFVGIFVRLVSLQINESKKYKTLSDKNRYREWKLAPQRGIIRDYFNREIASNEKVYQLHITPENTPNLDRLFFRLKTLLNLSDQKIFALKRKISKQKPWEPIIVSDNLSWSEFSRVNLFLLLLWTPTHNPRLNPSSVLNPLGTLASPSRSTNTSNNPNQKFHDEVVFSTR